MPLASRASSTRPQRDKASAPPSNGEVKLTSRRGKIEDRDPPADPPHEEPDTPETAGTTPEGGTGDASGERASSPSAPRQRKPRADAGVPRAPRTAKPAKAIAPGATPKEMRAQLKELEAAYKDAQKRQKTEQAELTRKHGDELGALQKQHREISTALSSAVFAK